MPATDHPAHGTTLSIKIASTFTVIGEVAEINDLAPEVKVREVTTLSSTSVKKRPAIVDFGKLALKVWLDPDDTTHILLRARVYSPIATLDEFKLTYNTGDTTPPFDDFMGFLTKFTTTVGGPMDTVTGAMEIEITDTFTSTAGTP